MKYIENNWAQFYRDTLTNDLMLILSEIILYVTSRGQVTTEYVSEIVVSDAIATQKRAFIYKSPLAWWKKGLGEGESLHAGTSTPPPPQKRVSEDCSLIYHEMVKFANENVVDGKSSRIDIYRSLFLTILTRHFLSAKSMYSYK